MSLIQKALALGRTIDSTLSGIKGLLVCISLLPAIVTCLAGWYEGLPWAMGIMLTTSALSGGLAVVSLGTWLYDRFFPSLYPVSLSIILEKAQRSGWKFGGGHLDIIDLVDALKQSGLSEEIVFWGRPDRNMFEDLTRNEPLNRIPADHWINFTINWPGGFNWNQGQLEGILQDGFNLASYSHQDQQGRGFKDLHVTGVNSKWLKIAAQRFRGRRQQQADRRNQVWAHNEQEANQG